MKTLKIYNLIATFIIGVFVFYCISLQKEIREIKQILKLSKSDLKETTDQLNDCESAYFKEISQNK
ncbi:MAG: hypothetical protein LC112_15325 [Flavobacteriales bacterium]|nr:hypothetical protein [Flavobacteriales bacterium]